MFLSKPLLSTGITETGVEFQRKHGANLTALLAGFIDRGAAASIEELVSNSYDADGTEIAVDFGDDTLTIADNGIGMRKGAGLEGFYRLGASDKLENKDSPNGRKRIGKFGVATILLSTLCESYELVTWRDKLETTVSETFAEELTSKKKIGGVEKSRRGKDTGTRITMSGLKFDPDEDFLTELERKFQWDLPLLPDFQVSLNGDPIKSKVFTKGTRFDCSGEGAGLGTVSGDLYYTASTSPSSGLHIYVNGRRVGDPKELLGKYTQKNSMIGHVTGIINADGLEPAIDFDRSRFKEYFEIWREFEGILRPSLNEIRKHLDVESTAKRSVSVGKQGTTLVGNVKERLTGVEIHGVNGDTTFSLDETGENTLGTYDSAANAVVLNTGHPQLILAGGMNAAQFERALLDATVSLLAQDRAAFRDNSLDEFLDEQRNIWAQINGMGDATNMEVTPGRYYSPAELARFGVFGSNTIRDLVAVGIIKGAAMEGERIQGKKYQDAVKELDGMVSITDLCRRKLGKADPPTVGRCTNVLNYAADQSRPFTYCIANPDEDDTEIHLVDSTMGSRVYAIGTKIPLDRGPDSGDNNRRSVREMFHKLADSYATIPELDENLDGVNAEQIQAAIEYASGAGLRMRNKSDAYRIGDVVTAFQSKRGNLRLLSYH